MSADGLSFLVICAIPQSLNLGLLSVNLSFPTGALSDSLGNPSLDGSAPPFIFYRAALGVQITPLQTISNQPLVFNVSVSAASQFYNYSNSLPVLASYSSRNQLVATFVSNSAGVIVKGASDSGTLLSPSFWFLVTVFPIKQGLVTFSLPDSVLFDGFGNKNSAISSTATFQPFFPSVNVTAIQFSPTISVLFSISFGSAVRPQNPSTVAGSLLASSINAISATLFSLNTSSYSGSVSFPNTPLLNALAVSASLNDFSDRFGCFICCN